MFLGFHVNGMLQNSNAPKCNCSVVTCLGVPRLLSSAFNSKRSIGPTLIASLEHHENDQYMHIILNHFMLYKLKNIFTYRFKSKMFWMSTYIYIYICLLYLLKYIKHVYIYVLSNGEVHLRNSGILERTITNNSAPAPSMIPQRTRSTSHVFSQFIISASGQCLTRTITRC